MEGKINNLKVEMAEVKKDIKYIKDELTDFRQTFKDGHDELVEMINKISENKADKWVEEYFKKFLWAIILAIVVAVLKLVLI